MNLYDRRQAYRTLQARACSTRVGPTAQTTQDEDQANNNDAVVSTIRPRVTATTDSTTQVMLNLLNILTSPQCDGISRHSGAVVSTILPAVVETTCGVETMRGVEVMLHALTAHPVEPLRLTRRRGWVSRSGRLW